MSDKSNLKISARDVNVFYGDKQAIRDVSIDIATEHVTAFIGPSGCGKSTFLRTLNRMNDTIAGCRIEGEIKLDGEDIYSSGMDVVQLRARVGMVFQKPNPFPKSIYENVAYGPRIHGLAASKTDMDAIVEKSLRRAGLWDEMKDRLNEVSMQNWFTCIDRALEKSGLTRDDIDYLNVLHMKRSGHVALLAELGLTEDQSTYLEDYGHMGQIDMILSLKLGLEAGKIKDGSIICSIAAGIGYVWAADVMRWGKDDE